MCEIILLRGVPGSGKTTCAKEKYPNHVLCEADEFFIDSKTGYYKYIPERIADAHEYCYNKVIENIEKGNDVVVANTFVHLWEMRPYLDLREKGHRVKIITLNREGKNTHNVPEEVVKKMRNEFEMDSHPCFNLLF